jgi:hypothetical protein
MTVFFLNIFATTSASAFDPTMSPQWIGMRTAGEIEVSG